jgi:hypothetical protein
MIRLGDGIYTSRIFYVEGPRCNVFGALQREDGKWILRWRFRHYVDDKAHDSDDEKTWYHIEPSDEATGLRALSDLVRITCMARGIHGVGPGATVDVIVVESADSQVAVDAMSRAPWAHVRVETSSDN